MEKNVPEQIQDRRVYTAVTWIRQQLSSPSLDINQIASAVNLSSSHLRHLFQRHLGMTAVRYHKLLRLQRARHLLQQSFLTVKEVMREVGWTDESHFCRDFKRAYGTPPSRERLARGVIAQGRGTIENGQKQPN